MCNDVTPMTERLEQILTSHNTLNKAIMSAALYDVYQTGEIPTQDQLNSAFIVLNDMLTVLTTEGDPNDIWPSIPVEQADEAAKILTRLSYVRFIIVNTRLLVKHRSEEISLDEIKALVDEAEQVLDTMLVHTLAAMHCKGEA